MAQSLSEKDKRITFYYSEELNLKKQREVRKIRYHTVGTF